MLLLTVRHTFKLNGPKLVDYSKRTCITLEGCFCSLLASKLEVNTGRSLYSFISFIQFKKNFVFSSFIEDIETNLPIGKHTLRVLYELLKRLFQKFVSTFNFCVCFCSLNFVSLFNELCCSLLSHIHLRRWNQGWQTDPNQSALHFEVVFVIL